MKKGKIYLVFAILLLIALFFGDAIIGMFHSSDTKTETKIESLTEGQLIDKKRELQKQKQEAIDGLNLEATQKYLQGDESMLELINKEIQSVDVLIQEKKAEQGLDYLSVNRSIGTVDAGYIPETVQKEIAKGNVAVIETNYNISTEGKTKVRHKGFGENDTAQAYVQYAYEISKGDLNFLATMDCENGQRDRLRQSEVVVNGVRETSYGLCQIYDKAHPDIIANPKFRGDWKFQIETCYDLYKGGTKFYGKTRLVNGVKCVDYVKSRFEILP